MPQCHGDWEWELATGPGPSEEVVRRALREGGHHCLFRDVISSSQDTHQSVDIPQSPYPCLRLCWHWLLPVFSSVWRSVAYSYPTLRDPVDCDTPGSLSITVSWSLLRFMSNCNLKNGLILIVDGVEQFPWVFSVLFSSNSFVKVLHMQNELSFYVQCEHISISALAFWLAVFFQYGRFNFLCRQICQYFSS